MSEKEIQSLLLLLTLRIPSHRYLFAYLPLNPNQRTKIAKGTVEQTVMKMRGLVVTVYTLKCMVSEISKAL